MATPAEIVAQGFQRGAEEAQQRRLQADQARINQRAQTAALYANAIQTPLPPATIKDAAGNEIQNPAYQPAFLAKQKAVKDYLAFSGPEHRANLWDRFHAAIFHPQQGAQGATTPVSSQAPQVQPPIGFNPTPTQALPSEPLPPAPTTDHPFASNPHYNKIQQSLNALGERLKAFAHPLPPEQTPDIAMLAAASSPEERERAQALELAEIKKEGTGGEKSINRYSTDLRAYAKSLNKSVTDLTDPELAEFDKQYEARTQHAPNPSQAALAVYLRAKYGSNPTANQIEEGTREHQKLMSGTTVGAHQQLVFDDQGVPHVVNLSSSSRKEFGGTPPTPPPSTQAPSLGDINRAALNAKQNAGTSNKRKLPVSTQAPSALDFTKGNPAVKASLALAGKELPQLESAEQGIDTYLQGGVFDGAGDLALQHAFFTATQPSTGFRMTKVQQDTLENSRSWLSGAQAKIYHAATGQWYTDEQRRQIAKTAKDAINAKKKVYQGILNPQKSSQAPQVPNKKVGNVTVPPGYVLKNGSKGYGYYAPGKN